MLLVITAVELVGIFEFFFSWSICVSVVRYLLLNCMFIFYFHYGFDKFSLKGLGKDGR